MCWRNITFQGNFSCKNFIVLLLQINYIAQTPVSSSGILTEFMFFGRELSH